MEAAKSLDDVCHLLGNNNYALRVEERSVSALRASKTCGCCGHGEKMQEKHTTLMGGSVFRDKLEKWQCPFDSGSKPRGLAKTGRLGTTSGFASRAERSIPREYLSRVDKLGFR